jgi:hypothetical protein
LAYDFFGGKVYAESHQDEWLLSGIREHFGNIFKRQMCGFSLYKYHISKTQDKYFEASRAGVERYGITKQ